MRFPKLDEIRAKLDKIFDEAGPELDVMKCSTLTGSRAERLAQIRALNDELADLREIERSARTAEELATGELGAEGGSPQGSAIPLQKKERLGNKDSVAAWARAKGLEEGSQLSAGVGPEEAWSAFYRGFAGGRWDDFRGMVKNQMGTTPDADGGFLVPLPLATDVIDRMRALTPIFEAGAVTVPMTSKTLDIARIAADVDATAWHAENAPIVATKPTLERVRFTAKTLPVLVKASRELVEDAPNTGAVVAQSIAGATAVELTRAALRGDGADDSPTGILSQTGILTTGVGGPATWTTMANAVRAIRDENGEPNAYISAPRTATELELQEDSTGQFIPPPPSVADLARFTTTVVPTNLGVGEDESEIYTADWRKLLIGLRVGLRIEPLRERFADDGQVAFLSWLRLDVQLEHPRVFHVQEGVGGGEVSE